MNNVEFVTMLRRPNGILDYHLRLVCADRIEALEAALRGIANDVTCNNGCCNKDIARRALEGKP